jgi:signal peptidase I
MAQKAYWNQRVKLPPAPGRERGETGLPPIPNRGDTNPFVDPYGPLVV